jgi:hypothetical protein
MPIYRKTVRFAVSVLLFSLLLASHLTPVRADDTSDDTVTHSVVFLPLLSTTRSPVNSLNYDEPDSTVEPSLLEQALIDHLKASQGSVAQAVDVFLAQNEDRVTIESSASLSLTPNSPDQPYGLHGFRKYTLGDEKYVFFAEDGFFIVSETVQEDTGEVQTSAIDAWTPVKSHTQSLYTWVGKISSITVQGQCEYNVSGAPKPNLVNAWHSRSFWGGLFYVNHWSSGTTKWWLHGHPWATIYGQANFQFGLHYEGNGWVWFNYWLRSELRCTDTGLIFGDGRGWQ